MAHTENEQRRSGKNCLRSPRIVLRHQGQFDSVLDNLRKDISKFKSNFPKNGNLRNSRFLNENLLVEL